MNNDFKDISLGFREIALLHWFKIRKALKHKDGADDQLKLYGLIYPIQSGSDSYGAPIYSEMRRISPRGERYLIYLHNQIWKFLFRSIAVPLAVAIIVAYITALITTRNAVTQALPPI